MARFRDLQNVFRMHPASAGPRPSMLSAKNAPVAQLDRAPDYESGGQEFESLRARHFDTGLYVPDIRKYRVRLPTSGLSNRR
jgi:hypothetical protein